MKHIFILIPLVLFLLSCGNSSQDSKCDYADKLATLSDYELSVHQKRGKNMLTLEDRIKLMENEKQGQILLQDLEKEFGDEKFEDVMNEVMECSDLRSLISKNSELIGELKATRELDDYYIQEILKIKIEDLKAIGSCEGLEMMTQLGNYQMSLFEKYGDMSNGSGKEALKNVEKLSMIISESVNSKYSEDELKKCSFFDTFLYVAERLGNWKKD